MVAPEQTEAQVVVEAELVAVVAEEEAVGYTHKKALVLAYT